MFDSSSPTTTTVCRKKAIAGKDARSKRRWGRGRRRRGGGVTQSGVLLQQRNVTRELACGQEDEEEGDEVSPADSRARGPCHALREAEGTPRFAFATKGCWSLLCCFAALSSFFRTKKQPFFLALPCFCGDLLHTSRHPVSHILSLPNPCRGFTTTVNSTNKDGEHVGLFFFFLPLYFEASESGR